MIGLVRATVICATLALGLTAAGAADKAFKRDDLANSADQAGGPDQERGGAGRQILRDAAHRRRRRLQALRFPRSACRSSGRSPPPRPKTAPTG